MDSEERKGDGAEGPADPRSEAGQVREDARTDTGAASREVRRRASFIRFANRYKRARGPHDRYMVASHQARIPEARAEVARARRARAQAVARASALAEVSWTERLEALRAQAASDRARLEAELRSAHLDALTGVYRREMGLAAISREIDRARRSDGRFILAFVDVDRLKAVNDSDGHAAGDRVLQAVVRAIRTSLRSFDPIVRYGGDEFLCGLGGMEVADAGRRFSAIEAVIRADAGVGISVGLAGLAASDTVMQLTERADAAMLEVKARHRSAR